MTSHNKTALIWHNHDLRLHDNALYAHAHEYDELVVIYTHIKAAQRGQAYYMGSLGGARSSFLDQTLSDLNGQLKRLGQNLHVIEHSTSTHVSHLIKEYGISDVYVSVTADYDVNRFRRSVSDQLTNVTWHNCVTETLFEDMPLDVLPETFTSFRKKIESDVSLTNLLNSIEEHPTPSVLPPKPKTFDAHKCLQKKETSMGYFSAGETKAFSHIHDYFDSAAPSYYKKTRNALDDWPSSTKFSPWLANGSLSVRHVLNRLRYYEENVVKNESTYWIVFELLWREYFKWYAHKHGSALFFINGVSNKKINRCFYPERFERWKNGTTPYPIVNACMNQLRETGYMSNRGRQIVASCFIHELNMDWRYGATYFEQQLLDYDVASNWANWQYLAGVGAASRGSRRFNLEKQTAQYDPNGDFVKKWKGHIGVGRIDSTDVVDWPILN